MSHADTDGLTRCACGCLLDASWRGIVHCAEAAKALRAGSKVARALLLSALLLAFLAATLEAETYRPAWSDADHDGFNAREELILAQCPVVHLTPDGKGIKAATCLDLYSGAEISTDTPSQSLHADHLYPAAEAWKRRAWTRAEFRAFFNDSRNLVLTRARTNLRKGDSMPQEWCPATGGARMLAAKRFRETAKRWRLPILPAEERGLRAWEAGGCASGARKL